MRRYNIYARDYRGVIQCARNLTQGKALKMHNAFIDMKIEHLIYIIKESDK